MNDLSDIKRINEQHAEKFGKAAGIEERRAEKLAKGRRLAASQQRARLTAFAARKIKHEKA